MTSPEKTYHLILKDDNDVVYDKYVSARDEEHALAFAHFSGDQLLLVKQEEAPVHALTVAQATYGCYNRADFKLSHIVEYYGGQIEIPFRNTFICHFGAAGGDDRCGDCNRRTSNA